MSYEKVEYYTCFKNEHCRKGKVCYQGICSEPEFTNQSCTSTCSNHSCIDGKCLLKKDDFDRDMKCSAFVKNVKTVNKDGVSYASFTSRTDGTCPCNDYCGEDKFCKEGKCVPFLKEGEKCENNREHAGTCAQGLLCTLDGCYPGCKLDDGKCDSGKCVPIRLTVEGKNYEIMNFGVCRTGFPIWAIAVIIAGGLAALLLGIFLLKKRRSASIVKPKTSPGAIVPSYPTHPSPAYQAHPVAPFSPAYQVPNQSPYGYQQPVYGGTAFKGNGYTEKSYGGQEDIHTQGYQPR